MSTEEKIMLAYLISLDLMFDRDRHSVMTVNLMCCNLAYFIPPSSDRYSKSVYDRSHFCGALHSGVLSYGCCPLPNQVSIVILSK